MNQQATRPHRPRDRRNQVATVAGGLFLRRGYHGVGINDIASAAGITGPALYRHFTDKQAILAHVLLTGIDDMVAVTDEALSEVDNPAPEQVETLLTTLAGLAVERREVTALWRWEGRHLESDDQLEIKRRSAGLLAAWSRALRQLRPELLHADAELLCWAALSVYGSVAVHRTSIPKRRFEQLLHRMAHDVLHVTLPATPDGAVPPAQSNLRLAEPSRREQVLTAATKLFHQHGFHAVSMEDIGNATGIAGPSVYRHFPSKAGLLAAICQRAADRLAVGAEYALHTSAPPDEATALHRLTESYVHTVTASPELAVAFSTEPVHIDDRDRAEMLRVQRDYVARWVQLLGTVRPNLARKEAKITVHAALTIANDLTRTRRVNTRPHLAPELVTLMTAALGTS